MNRFVLIFNRFIHSFKMWFRLRKEFNSSIAFWMCYAYVLPSQKHQKYIEAMRKYFEKDLSYISEQYKNRNRDEEIYYFPQNGKIPIWICWLTGFDTMPELVRVCFSSVLKAIPDYAEIKLITADNFTEYVNVPSYILEKFSKGIISPAHFSDILRFSLLSQYGGMWLDATVYVSGTIPDSCLKDSYYTQKIRDKSKYPYEPSHAQWCGFIWAGYKGNLLFSYVRDGLFEYWKKYDTVVDYIFFDYIILTAYNNIPAIREMMDNCEPNNEEIWDLWKQIDKKYDKRVIDSIFAQNIFHKLTYKASVPDLTDSGEQTVYAFLKECQQ